MIVQRWYPHFEHWSYCRSPLYLNVFLKPKRLTPFQRALNRLRAMLGKTPIQGAILL